MSAERVVYLDSSALVKLVNREAASAGLRDYLLTCQADAFASSALARVELVRAVRSFGPPRISQARTLLDLFHLTNIDDSLLDEAALMDDAAVRTLDAIHIAAARRFGDDLLAVVTYDRRMARAAEMFGLPVESPA